MVNSLQLEDAAPLLPLQPSSLSVGQTEKKLTTRKNEPRQQKTVIKPYKNRVKAPKVLYTMGESSSKEKVLRHEKRHYSHN
jgi:hypothetical protein